MKIVWDWSLESETQRVLDAARGIGNGFYRLHHFLPLAWSPRVQYVTHGVYLPLLNYILIPRFWSQVSRLDASRYPLNASIQLVAQTRSLLEPLSLTPPETDSLEQIVEKILPKVISFIKQLAPAVALPTTITIHPTYFGTGGSFSDLIQGNQIVIYLRTDRGIRSLVECLLTAILRHNANETLAASWNETEFLIDWLIYTSALTDMLPPDPTWIPTIKQTRTTASAAAIKQSEELFMTIGAPTSTTQKFSLKNNHIYYNQAPLTNLTLRETQLLTQLIEHAPLPLTTEEIGSLLFTSDDQFSLNAITKTMERLRNKLDTLGISSAHIATAPNLGYYLQH